MSCLGDGSWDIKWDYEVSARIVHYSQNMNLFSEKTLSDEYSVWWCGALTYLRTRDIFSQNEDYIAADFRKIKEVGAPTAREA